MDSKIQLRQDTAANWLSVNPVLSLGEYGLETDTGLVKIGDGSGGWADLHYHAVPATIINESSTSFSFPAALNLLVRCTSASATAVTIDPVATTARAVGALVGIRQADAGTVTLTTTGLTINGTVPAFAQHTEVWLRHLGADVWDVL